ncbi:helix-turn-helix transcriptional regulator [Porphyrobacter sp. AAP60]|uniref:helix-turn-helix transcriptional regulator n=1 Tax=Porphyrobacter sp. AAP60 TaxID=1523423 RepID=UPI0009E9173C|nr:helix-turn-helix transcriptional regulator [Porphyrobacter sp. AAP60]
MVVNAENIHRISERIAPRSLAHRAAIRSRGDILDAAIALAQEAQLYGVRLIVWPDLATFEPMLDADGEPVNTRVFGWLEAEIAACHQFEAAAQWPVLRMCRTESEPFAVNRADIRTVVRTVDLADHLRHDTAFGTTPGDAVMLRMQLPFGQVAAALVAHRELHGSGMSAQPARFVSGAVDAIRKFIAGYVNITQEERYLPPATVLSQREVECLGWVAHGKIDYEISVILGCSHASVRYHVTRACAKLDASNRAQAVFRACQLGCLSPRFAALHE